LGGGVSEKLMGPPNTSGERFTNKHTKELKNEETMNLFF
jgi:hypothetical protein